MEMFPRKPLLDRIIVQEIPVKEFYRQSGDVLVDLDNSNVKILSDRGRVVAVGDFVSIGGAVRPMPVVVGDIVYYDEFAMCDPVYLNPADKNDPNLPKFWQMRVADLKGVDVENRIALVEAHDRKRAEEGKRIAEIQLAAQKANGAPVN